MFSVKQFIKSRKIRWSAKFELERTRKEFAVSSFWIWYGHLNARITEVTKSLVLD